MHAYYIKRGRCGEQEAEGNPPEPHGIISFCLFLPLYLQRKRALICFVLHIIGFFMKPP